MLSSELTLRACAKFTDLPESNSQAGGRCKVTRKRRTAEFKARAALEAIKGQKLAEIGARHGVHLTMVAAWKKMAVGSEESKRENPDQAK